MLALMTGDPQDASKFLDVIIEVVLPEKMAHMSRRKEILRALQHLAVTSRDTAFLKVLYEVQEDSKGMEEHSFFGSRSQSQFGCRGASSR
jgi:hypothetical protein